MRRGLQLTAMLCWLGSVAAADVAELADEVIGPAYQRFAEETATLAAAAAQDCTADTLRAPFQNAWDAWAKIGFFRLGPVEDAGRSLAISFWPDPKSSGRRTQQGLAETGPPVLDDPAGFARISVAARGLSGLERLLYPPGLTGGEDVLCRLRRATASDLARMAGEIAAEWPDFADLLRSAGEAGNQRYLSAEEARQAVYTQLITGLNYTADTRMGRPLGTPEKPRPERAESRAAGRSLRNIEMSLRGMRDAALALDPKAQRSAAAFDLAISLAAGLDDPVFDSAADPEGRAGLIELQRAVRQTRNIVEEEIGQALGVGVGFNAMDGD